MTPLFNAMKQAYTQAGEKDAAQWQAAFDAKQFYIVAEVTFVGQYAMGSTEFMWDGVTFNAPCLLATKEAAHAELEEEKADFTERLAERNDEELQAWVDSGEEADDFDPETEDDFAYEVFMVKWDGGDKITIMSECGQFVDDDQNTWQFHCGMN